MPLARVVAGSRGGDSAAAASRAASAAAAAGAGARTAVADAEDGPPSPAPAPPSSKALWKRERKAERHPPGGRFVDLQMLTA